MAQCRSASLHIYPVPPKKKEEKRRKHLAESPGWVLCCGWCWVRPSGSQPHVKHPGEAIAGLWLEMGEKGKLLKSTHTKKKCILKAGEAFVMGWIRMFGQRVAIAAACLVGFKQSQGRL